MKSVAKPGPEIAASACRQKFLRFFPQGFNDVKYLEWERNYKSEAHARWAKELGRESLRELLFRGRYMEVAQIAISIESRTNLLFSFEKMAIRDAVKSISGACTFSVGLYEFLYGKIGFDEWCSRLANLPQEDTRTIVADRHSFSLSRHAGEAHLHQAQGHVEAARAYEFSFPYEAAPSKEIYEGFLGFAEVLKNDLEDLQPRDMMDIQSFTWVLGSDEYHED